MKSGTVSLVLAGLVLVGAGALYANEPGKPAPHGDMHAKQGQGKGWDRFAAAFDANKDGKVTKDELMARHPGFDKMDMNKDGVVTQDEVKALPASTNHPNLPAFVSKFDENQDGKVTLDEFNDKRTKAFERMDKNHDGAIEKTEVTPAGTQDMM